MGKKERLEKELDFLRERYRNYFLILIGLLTGEVTVIYAVITGEKPIYALLLATIGLGIISIVANKIKQIEEETYYKLDELEKE